jgi:hypothetical protein
MPALIARGEMDFVLDQYRKCWGWMLEDDRTTWVEVFDTRWSHCHQWAGCPTWQLTRYALGLTPRFDLGPNCFEWTLNPGSLSHASGRVPIPGKTDGATIGVEWRVAPDGTLAFTIDTPAEITVLPNGAFGPRRTVAPGRQSLAFVKGDSGWSLQP